MGRGCDDPDSLPIVCVWLLGGVWGGGGGGGGGEGLGRLQVCYFLSVLHACVGEQYQNKQCCKFRGFLAKVKHSSWRGDDFLTTYTWIQQHLGVTLISTTPSCLVQFTWLQLQKKALWSHKIMGDHFVTPMSIVQLAVQL